MRMTNRFFLGAMFALLTVLVSNSADAGKCRWTVTGKMVDKNGKALRSLRVRVEARWANPPGWWNNKNWRNPKTKSDGSFKSNNQVGSCTKIRDLRIKVKKGSKWRFVKKFDGRRRGTNNLGTIKVRFLKQNDVTPPKSAYIKNVRPLVQEILKNPRTQAHERRLEGCGPVAAAQLLAYWRTERNKRKVMTSYREDRHPSFAIRRLFSLLKADPAPKGQSLTLPDNMALGLKAAVKNKGLRAHRMRDIHPWKKRKAKIKELIRKRRPVLILLKNIPGCLSGERSKKFGWHYVVANGYSSSSLYLVTGWAEMAKTTTSGPGVHHRSTSSKFDDAHAKCSWREIKKAVPGLFWVK
jgi:hypothetical protein